MVATSFLVTMGAVMSANILSFGFIWSLYKIHQSEKKGGEAPILFLVIMLVCLVFMGGGIYLSATAAPPS